MAKELGPFSRKTAVNRLDKRTAPARLMKKVRRDLLEHLGNRPLSITESMIVDQICWLHLHVSLANAKASEGGEMSDIFARTYQGWSSSLQKALMRLDATLVPKPTADASPNALAEYIKMKSEVEREA
ncbi:hypothetical protein ACFQY5_41330 [Paeniroseomonas aquatica]|uniref:Uncharacterized protein n=1 Tax=Paeniroseomonas aquatica TaxID=373043 RepID=A0ABT8AFU3_9PROT|nr:hypothetical protein [Paeniroseomonas aquatica]MDN3568656.1 hypothetical protein [Paeniroseomonas aquatica]